MSSGVNAIRSQSNAAETLAKLSPGSPGLITAPGGIPSLTPQDIAAAMAMGHLTKAQEKLLLVKYCGFEGELDQLIIELWMYGVDLDLVKDKDIARGSLTRKKLAVWVIGEYIGANLCPKCRGTKYTKAGKVCPKCDGVGHKYRSPSYICERVLGLDHSYWRRGWGELHSAMGKALAKWEADGLAGLIKALD